MNIFNKKQCPRCNEKMPVEIVICPSCQLNFQKFETATNQEAKEAIKAGEKDRVLMRKGLPSDVKKFPLLMFTLLLGFMGAHHYYVGRYKAGMFYTIFCFVGIVNAILTTLLEGQPAGEVYQVFTFLVLIWGLVLVLWIIDIAKVCFNKFKIPVSRSK